MLHSLNPLSDPRWHRLVERHPGSSVFHSVAWMSALSLTCRYEPIAYTTTAPGNELENGIAFCRIRSSLTGSRLVSLPFADHCDPLNAQQGLLDELGRRLDGIIRNDKLGHVELRSNHPISPSCPAALGQSTYEYRRHVLDLAPSVETLFHGFHRASTRRKIRRAEREGLLYSEGSSAALFDSFYQLHLSTRRRHQIPALPKVWFRNLMECFGEDLKIRISASGERSVAAMLTIRHKDTLVFKYGVSDARFHALGGVHLLFWRSILDAKQANLSQFDLGRSEAAHTGLTVFKDRWGATSLPLTYSRFSYAGSAFPAVSSADEKWKTRAARRLVCSLPGPLFRSASTLLFRHLG